MPNSASPALLAGLATLVACAPGAWPIVTEVFYDAIGDDTGWEFVELWNRSDRDVPLSGVTIEAGDGAGPGRWAVRWTGGARDTVHARARFVVGGAHVVPAPDAPATLDLQNGPDGMRVTWPDGTREIVGWGSLGTSEYSCGTPAPDASAGQSLARVPDDADLGGNALDFRPSEPSPGTANRPDADVGVLRGSLSVAPEEPQPGEAVRAELGIVNRGARSTIAGAAFVTLAGDALADTAQVALDSATPGETLHVSVAAFAGAAGRRALLARVNFAGDGVAANDADTLAVRVGPGPLEVTEIQFHPAAGEGEWIECRNRSPDALALEGFTLSDRGTARARIVDTQPLEPDSLVVLAQDRAALLAAFPALDPARVIGVSPWPALNNTDGADGFADQVVLREPDGLVSDRVAYSSIGVPAGTSLEKDAGAWRPAGAPNGTPLAPPSRERDGPSRFVVQPRRLTLQSPEVELSWRLPWPSARVTVELYDLAGRRIARLLDGELSAASGSRRARIDAVGPGVYVMVLRARGARGTLTRSEAVRVAGPLP